jgi:hypothetical protein
VSYLTQDRIASSTGMNARVAQAAASETLPEGYSPDAWTQQYRRDWAAAPGWDEAWESAMVGHEDEPTYDPGTNEAVITDGMILSQIQSML